MIPGFNHNIKHKGRVYHIQTEDSGPKNPHIITHLFVGGNILASKKTEYTDILGQPDYEKTVRSMMEEQHKQMLRNLVNGVYDTVATGQAYHLDGPPPVNFTATSPTTAAMAGASAFKGLPSQVGANAGANAGASPPATPPPVAAAPVAAPAVPPSVIPGPGLSVPRPITAPHGVPAPSPLEFSRPTGGIPVAGTPPVASEPPPPEVAAAQQERAEKAKVAASAGTIFGENLISEKSLDEVILGYLAEDLADSE